MKIHNYDTELPELLPCPFCGGEPVAYLKANQQSKKRSITITESKRKTQKQTQTITESKQ